MTTNDVKIEIINLITQIDDIEQLKLIYREIEEVGNKVTTSAVEPEKNLAFKDAIVEIRQGVSFKEFLKEQHYQPISYQGFRAIADQIKWEHSLDELLAAID